MSIPDTNSSDKKALARFIVEKVKDKSITKEQASNFLRAIAEKKVPSSDIAIVGMGCRFPKADNKEEFWKNLCEGVNCIREYPKSRREDLAGIDNFETELFRGGFLSSVDGFDNEYFQIPPNIAKHLDPYHRQILEVLVETIEDAGYSRNEVHGQSIGVFVGNDHTHRLFNSYVDFVDDADFNTVTGSWTAVLASRLSYLFNFKGPAVVLDTSCSSALVALDSAIKAIRNGDCDSALVAAANLFFLPGKGLVGDVENDDFEIRAFDKNASGTTWGEGVASIHIKPLDSAIEDGDDVYAVIKGVAINSDGASNGLTAPNSRAQQEVMLKAWSRANVNPEDVSYIEAHGTGTLLGDPIEIKGLYGAFSKYTKRKQFCGLGSVKTNIGHTVGVAGLASVIKVVMSLRNEIIPKSLNFAEPNTHIDFCNSPIYIADETQHWPKKDTSRTAGVSSFSLSGTNCHVVLQEAPEFKSSSENKIIGSRKPQNYFLVLSGRTRELLTETVRRYVRYVDQLDDIDLESFCYTAAVGREQHDIRSVILFSNLTELKHKLRWLSNYSQEDHSAENALEHYVYVSGESQDDSRLSNKSVTKLIDPANIDDRVTHERLAALYVNGGQVNWAKLFTGRTVRRLHIPTQPFKYNRFWAKAPRTKKYISNDSATESSLNLDSSAGAKKESNIDSKEELLALVISNDSCVKEVEFAKDDLAISIVAYIWREVLGYDSLSKNDDYYALGGDSISGVRIVSYINHVFGISVDISDLLVASSLQAFKDRLVEKYDFLQVIEDNDSPNVSSENELCPVLPQKDYPENSYALSHAQTRIYLIDKINPGSVSYNVNSAVRLENQPDIDSLNQALNSIIQRHEILRTGFGSDDQKFVQTVYPHMDFTIDVLSTVDRLDGETDSTYLRKNITNYIMPFDIAKPPLLRVGVLHVKDDASYIIVDMHHIITDGSSMGSLINEFLSLSEGRKLPDLTVQYKDYAAWHSQKLIGGEFDLHKQYWLSQLSDSLSVVNLPYDYPRPLTNNYEGAKHQSQVHLDLDSRLQKFAREQGVTYFMLLLAAFNVLVYKLGGGNSIVVGTPVAGRPNVKLTNLIGMFVNTVVLKNSLQSDVCFSDFLKEVKQNTLEAYEHQEYPYEVLVEDLALPRETNRNPLFDIYFVLQNEDMGFSNQSDVNIVEIDSGTSKFDLTFIARTSQEGLNITWEYSTSLFSSATIERFDHYFERVLQQIVDMPEKRVDTFSLLSQKEENDLLAPNHCARLEYSDDYGMHHYFEVNAETTPNAVALVFRDEEYTYKDLNIRANKLAAWIQQQALSNSYVGLFYPNSVEMIVAILAVLKSGNAYLPLDIDNTTERNKGILLDCQVEIVLCAQSAADKMSGFEVNIIASDSLDLTEFSECNADIAVSGSDVAYVIYTSGSTGKPKGTVICHRSVKRVVWQTNYVDLSASDRFVQTSNYAFDGSIFPIWGAFFNGGVLVLPQKKDIFDMDTFSDILINQSITVFFITTSLFNILVDMRLESLGNIRYVLVGGEQASAEHVKRAVKFLGANRVFNVYGPTEATVFASAYSVNSIDDIQRNVPIGTAITNTRLYVLDEGMQLVPPGVVGELYIGGDGVALEYLGREDLTQNKFVPDVKNLDERMYASGDIVKYDGNGCVTYAGRVDHQVKIRGFRVELNEIESILSQHESVRECLVLTEVDSAGQIMICAYAVLHDEDRIEIDKDYALKVYLCEHLPDYMVPKSLCVLSSFPINVNGKVDRKKLPKPEIRIEAFLAAIGPAEETIVKIWEEVLAQSRVSTADNFFARGGDSIKAIQAAARIKEKGIHCEVADFFRYPVLREFAAYVNDTSQDDANLSFPLTPIEAKMHGQALISYSADINRKLSNKVLVDRLEIIAQKYGIFNGVVLDGVNMSMKTTEQKEVVPNSFSVVLDGERNNGGDEIIVGIDPSTGVWMQLELLLKADTSRLNITAHPSALDLESVETISSLIQLSETEFRSWTDRSGSDNFWQWRHAFHQHISLNKCVESTDYWLRLIANIDGEKYGHNRFEEIVSDRHEVRFSLETSSLLERSVHQAYNTDLLDISSLALANALNDCFGTDLCIVEVTGNMKRQEPIGTNLSETLGNFAVCYPHEIQSHAELASGIIATKEAIRRVPNHGIDFEILRSRANHLTASAQDPISLYKPKITLNPFATQNTAFMSADTDIAISIFKVHDHLVVEFNCQKKVDKLPLHFEYWINEIVNHCSGISTSQKTASDFSDLSLNQNELDDILEDLT